MTACRIQMYICAKALCSDASCKCTVPPLCNVRHHFSSHSITSYAQHTHGASCTALYTYPNKNTSSAPCWFFPSHNNYPNPHTARQPRVLSSTRSAAMHSSALHHTMTTQACVMLQPKCASSPESSSVFLLTSQTLTCTAGLRVATAHPWQHISAAITSLHSVHVIQTVTVKACLPILRTATSSRHT